MDNDIPELVEYYICTLSKYDLMEPCLVWLQDYMEDADNRMDKLRADYG